MQNNSTKSDPQSGPMIRYTQLMAPPDKYLAKEFRLDEDGKPKSRTRAQFSHGRARHIEVRSPEEFRIHLESIAERPNIALCYGVVEDKNRIDVVTKENFKGGAHQLTRSREFFAFKPGPTILMLDYDPDENHELLDLDEYRTKVIQACPALSEAPMVGAASSSSWILHSDTGTVLKGPGGLRLYVFLDIHEGSEIHRAGMVLHERLWLRGDGYYKVGAAGQMLDRSLVDTACWQPERLDFVGGAAIARGNPLIQRRPKPLIWNPDGAFLDSRIAFPALSAEELQELNSSRSNLRKAASERAAEVREKWIDERSSEMAGPEADEAKIQKTRDSLRRALEGRELPGDFILHPESGGRVTVAEILSKPESWDGKRFADPLDPGYKGDSRIATANLRSSQPHIYSFAHGGIRYGLRIQSDGETEGGVDHPESIFIDPDAPYATAQEFINAEWSKDGIPTLRFYNGTWYTWGGAHYSQLDDKLLESKIYAYSDRCLVVKYKPNGDVDKIIPFKPNKNHINEIKHALQARSIIAPASEPAWLVDVEEFSPSDLLACSNGLVDVRSRALLPSTPDYFNLMSVPFEYDSSATTPEKWLRFLEAIWPSDPESIGLLQEMFGYFLTSDTSQQKIFMIIGPPRSGKGTIGRVLTALLGKRNVASPTLASLAQTFGRQSLIGKNLALVSDARLSWKQDQAQIVEELLSISGEDARSIPRKYKDDWFGPLRSRFLLLTNELPTLNDSSGALASRILLLELEKSFLGKEDTALSTDLLQELPAILNWSLEGLDRLRERTFFHQPAKSADAVDELMCMSSPIKAFAQDRCEFGDSFMVSASDLFDEYRDWCDSNGTRYSGTRQIFGRNVRSGLQLTSSRVRRNGGQVRAYKGIRIRPAPIHVLEFLPELAWGTG